MKKFLVLASLLMAGLCVFAAQGASSDLGAQLYDEYKESIVQILPPDGRPKGGTGFAIRGPSGKPYLVTNGHVCDVAVDGKVAAKIQGQQRLRILKVIEVSETTDLCLVEGIESAKPLPIASNLFALRRVHVLGYPRLRPLTYSMGYVVVREEIEISMGDYDEKTCKGPSYSRAQVPFMGMLIDLCVRKLEAIDTSAVIYPGNSGSPVFNDRGSVVGVIFAGSNDTNFGAMIPLEQLKDFISIY